MGSLSARRSAIGPKKVFRSIRDQQHAAVFYADCRSVCRLSLQMREIFALNENGEMILGHLRTLLVELVKSKQRANESGRRQRALFCQVKASKHTGFFAGPDAPYGPTDFKIKRQAFQCGIVDDDLSILLNIVGGFSRHISGRS